jgi:hypothetical protein
MNSCILILVRWIFFKFVEFIFLRLSRSTAASQTSALTPASFRKGKWIRPRLCQVRGCGC